MERFVLGMSGASGQIYALRVLQELIRSYEVHLVASGMALSILRDETGLDWTAGDSTETGRKMREHFSTGNIHCWAEDDMGAPVSSGSFRTRGMLVVPCSMKSLSGIASGYAETLLQRAADVTIKEGRPLLLAPRETPLSAIHRENMLKLARLGVRIVPPMPAFYHKPESIDEIIDFVAGKILDAMGVGHDLFKRWGEDTTP